MARDEDDLPPRSGSRVVFGRKPAIEAAPEVPGIALASSWGRQLLGALALSVALGSISGYLYGGRTGVGEGVAAGARRDQASADSSVREAENLRLLNDVRGLRAQVEQLRHGAEAERAAVEETNALAAQLRDVSARLERLERAAVDRTPVGAIAAPPKSVAAAAPKAKHLSR